MPEIILGDTVVVSDESPTQHQGPSAGVPGKVQIVSLEQASTLAGFKIWQPTHLPSPGLALDRVGVATATGTPQVVTTFLKYRETALRWLVLHQRPIVKAAHGPGRWTVPAAIRGGHVGARPAAFYDLAVAASDLPGGQLTIACCLWEHGGFLMDLQAPQFPAGELARTGASLA